jgi:Bacteriocin-protection, YdeI or OmpD-Associated
MEKLKVDRTALCGLNSLRANDQTHDSLQSKTLPAGREREGRLLDLSHPTEERPWPADLRKALAAAAPKARELWSDITHIARRGWIHWITSAKQPETRARVGSKVPARCSLPGSNAFAASTAPGFYRKSMSAPKAAV